MEKIIDIDLIKNSINQILKEFKTNKELLEKYIDLDYNECGLKIEYSKMISIIETYFEKEIICKFNKFELINGIGALAVINNENPYYTLSTCLAALRTNNTVAFYQKDNMYSLNKFIIDTFSKISYPEHFSRIKVVSYIDFIKDSINYDSLLFIGKYDEYIYLSKKLNIPIIFEPYGDINVYVDDISFKSNLIDIDKMAYSNCIQINYLKESDIDLAIKKINSESPASINVIFTKNTEKAIKFLKDVKSSKIYVNKNPFENLNYILDENKLVYKKEIYYK